MYTPRSMIEQSPFSSPAKRQRSSSGKFRNNGGDQTVLLLSNVSLRRYQMTIRISKLVQHLERKSRKPFSAEQATALAQRLESIIYKTSPSFEAYANETSALARVRTILSQKQKQAKKTSQAAAAAESPKNFSEKRIEFLQEILGTQKMEEIRQIINEVRAIRSTNTSWAGILRAAQGDENKPPAKMPQEVDAVYFRTHLIEAYAHVSSTAGPLDLGRVTMYDWTELISEAKTNIAAFRALEKNHEEIIASTPLTCCVGGMCSRKGSFARSA